MGIEQGLRPGPGPAVPILRAESERLREACALSSNEALAERMAVVMVTRLDKSSMHEVII